MRNVLLLYFALFAFSGPALAVNPDEVLKDPALEERARDISSKLRCLVCQNQSIDGSDAALAKDLRVLVRDRLTAGDSDAQIFDYVVARYGEFVLLQPRIGSHTFVLWFMPIVVLILGIGIFIVRSRNMKTTKIAGLTNKENELIEKALREDD